MSCNPATRYVRFLALGATVTLVLVAARCDPANPNPGTTTTSSSTSTSTTTSTTTTIDPGEERAIADLYADPASQDEIDTVLADWASRDTSAVDFSVVASGTLGGATIDIVAHTMPDGDIHYGAVRHAITPGASHPVLITNHGGQSGFELNREFGKYNASGGCYDDFVIVAPSYRAETLDASAISAGLFTSEGDAGEHDGDVDDTMALLSGVLEDAAYSADDSRVASFGGSRGAGVSLILSVRDDRIGTVAAIAGATDLTLPEVQASAEQWGYPFGGRPTAAVTNTAVDWAIKPYLDGDLTLDEARLELIRRSPVYFISETPPVMQTHHGALDDAVPIEQGDRLAEVMAELGFGDDIFEYFRYETGTHNGATMPGADDEVADLMCSV